VSQYASYPSLDSRAVFVTGGGSGIGASIVEHFCAQRARVAFVDIERGASEALVDTLAAHGYPVPSFIACDGTSALCKRRLAKRGHDLGLSGSWSTTPPTTSAMRSTV